MSKYQKMITAREHSNSARPETRESHIVRLLLPNSISDETVSELSLGLEKYEKSSSKIDWTRYYSCMRPPQEQFSMVASLPHAWLAAIPDFMQMLFADYAEQRGDPQPIPSSLIQSWFSENLKFNAAVLRTRKAG